MPTKTYNYKTVIGVVINSGGATKGASEIEKELTKTEKRALKMIETVKKALESLDKAGINSAKFEAANARIISSNERVTRSVRASEAQKLKLTEQVRREQIKTAELKAKADERSAFASERNAKVIARLEEQNRREQQKTSNSKIKEADRAASAQIKAAREVAREEQRSYQSRAKFALDQQTREERYNQSRFRSAQQYYREMERQSNLETRRVQQAERAVKQSSQRRIENVSMVGGGLQSAGLTATAIATAPIVAGFYAAIKAGSEYETSMNTLQAVTNATAEEMKRAAELAVQLGNDISLPGVSALDASEAMTELGKAGFTVSQAMAAAKGTLQLATAANISAGQAAEITANALNMFKLRAEEAGRVADLLAGAANASSAEITDVAASLQQAGSVFAAANVPIEDTVALIAEMANQGIKGSDAGTSLKTMMQRLQSPTADAADAMKALRIEIFDAQGKMKPMREIIGQFEKSLGTLSEQQKAQALNTIFGSDAVRAANIVFSEGVKGFDKMSEAVQRSNAAAELAAARTKGLAGSWDALISQAETLGLIIFNRIKEPLTDVVLYIATFASEVTDAFINLPESAQKFILALLAIAAAVGPVLTVVGSFVVALGAVASGLMTLAGTATVGAAISALAPIFAAIIVIIAGLTAGITAAIAVVYELGEAWENGFGPVASIVAIGAAAILSALSPVLGIPVLIGAMLATLYKIWETNFGGLRDLAIAAWKTISDVSSEAMLEINRFVGEIGGEIVAWWRANYPFIKEIVETVNAAISSGVQTFLNAVSNLWNAHGTTIRTIVSYIWESIKSTVTFAIKTVSDILTIGLQLINGNWEGAWNSFLVIVRRTAKFVTAVISEMNSMIVRAIITVGKWLFDNSTAILKKVGEITGIGLKYIVSIIAGLPIVLIKLVPKFVSAGFQIGSAIWQGIKDGLANNAGSETAADLGIDVDSLFNIPENPLENIAAGVGDLTKKMEKLGETTDSATDKTTKFNKELADSGGKSRKKAVDEIGNLSSVLDAMRAGTMAQESGGNSRIQNTRTKATGLFQVMPANIPEWTRNTFGRVMTVEQFQNSPQAQIAVFNKYMGDYLEKAKMRSGGDTEKTIRMAAAAWYGGEGAMGKYDNWKRFRADEPSFGEYTSSVYRRTQRSLNGKNFRDVSVEDFGKISDEITQAEQDRITQASIEAFKLLRERPDDDLISKYNRILVDQARKAGKLQPSVEDTAKEFAGFSTRPDIATEITTKSLDRRSQRFLETDESLNLTKRRKELDERRLYLADEILAKENDYILALQETQTDLQVEAKLLVKRNSSFEAANEFSRQQNAQTKELQDIEVALSVLRQQNADDQFVQQRRLLASKREQISLEQDITDLQDKLATQGENAALRYQAAWMKAIYDVKDADTRAVESQIESQVRIADAATIHVEQIRADVLDALASQKTLSQTIADEIVGVYEKIGEASDKFLDKTIGKIPVIGGIAKNLARQSLTRITTGLLDTFLPGMSQAFESTGNPLLDENKKQTKSLQNIEKSLGGVGGLGNIGGGGGGPSSGSSGGGILGMLKNILGGGRGASGNSTTPPFVGNFTGSGNRTGDVIDDVMQVFAGDKGRDDLWSNLKFAFSGKDGSIFGKGGIFGEKGFGNNSGTYGAIGGGVSLLGGFISNRFGGSAFGRRLGGILSGAGTGMSIGAMFGGPLGAVVGAAVGGLIGLFTSGGQRKKDEKARNQGMIDALGAIDKLINDVNNNPDFTDVAGIVSQGQQIRQSYLDMANSLKDNKTRGIALRDVSRVDTKLRDLENVAKAKAARTKSRAESLALDVPTFSDGGSISKFIGGAYQNNPLGYITGPGSSRSDSILARVSNGEYILDAATVRNLGTAQLDALRLSKGNSLKYMREPLMKFADGGGVGSFGNSTGSNNSNGSTNIEVRNNFVYNEATGTLAVQTDVVQMDASGKEFIIRTVSEEIENKQNQSKVWNASKEVDKRQR